MELNPYFRFAKDFEIKEETKKVELDKENSKTTLIARDYQVEISEFAKRQNSIVVLDTGSGKSTDFG